MNHAKQLFPIALSRLIEIGEKGVKQREQGERAGHVARPRGARACMQATRKEKQLTLQLQTRI